MANQEKIQKIEAELKMLNETLTKYGDMFKADGDIDTKEQKQLDSMQAIIKKIKAKLLELKDGGKEKKGTKEGLGKTKFSIFMEELNETLNELEAKYNLGK